MARYQVFKYSDALYGFSALIDYVLPSRGPSTGGTPFVIIGEHLAPTDWDDDFTGGSLDVTKWSDDSTGSGAVATGTDHLQLSTGSTPGSVAAISSVADWSPLQAEVRAILPTITVFPDSAADLFCYRYRADSSNYAAMRIEVDSVGTLNLVCEVYVAGTLVSAKETSWTYGLSVFRILRFGEIVQFIAGGNIIHEFRGFTVLPIYADILCANDPTVAYEVNVTVGYFEYAPFVVFGEEPVHDVVSVSPYRMKGKTPASVDAKAQAEAYAGPVDVTVVGFSEATLADAFEYYFEDSLKVVNSSQSNVLLSFIGDAQIKTKSTVKKGIGL